MSRSIGEIDAPVSKKTGAAINNKEETKEERPLLISELNELGEKLILRPFPMHIEALIEHYLATDIVKLREDEIGVVIVDGINAEIASPKIDETNREIIEYLAHIVASKTALAYCRVCDNVFRTVDAFYTHIQSPAHMEMNMNRPCAECARIWAEYGGMLAANSDLSIEFAFRSHPLHTCVTLLNMVLECFRDKLDVEICKAIRASSSRPVKFPSKEQLKQIAKELESVVTVPISMGFRHGYACVEKYQVAMHCHVEKVTAIYEKFLEECKKRDAESRLFSCDICRLVLPSSRHFRLHLLSEHHDTKMAVAPTLLSALYNPLCQMNCFMERKIQKKMENKKERQGKKVEKEHNSTPVVAKKEKGKKKAVKEEMKEESKKETKRKRSEEPLVVVDESEDSPFVVDKRGLLVYRMGHPQALAAQKKEIKVIRRERTESEKAADDIVYII